MSSAADTLPGTLPGLPWVDAAAATGAPAKAQALALQGHWPALDGLRGIAILLVLPHNLLPTVDAGNWWFRLVGAWCERGWIGVQLFFVLSGFLITGILLDTRKCQHGLAVFYARRVLRIFPLYYAVLALTLLAWPMLSSALGLAPPAHATSPLVLRSYWLYLSNWVSPFHAGEGVLPHLWSLAVEEQFYLIWPLLIWFLRPRAVLVLSLGVALASLASRLVLWSAGASTDALYQFTICRVDALTLGAAVAAWLRLPGAAETVAEHGRKWLAVACVVFVAGGLASRGWQPLHAGAQTVGYTLLALVCALVVLCIVLGGPRPTAPGRAGGVGGPRLRWLRWLAQPWLRRVGLYSYGMYLLHVPLAWVLASLAASHGADAGWAWLGQGPMSPVQALLHVAVISLLTFGLAALSYHGFEAFFLRLKPPYLPTDLRPVR